MKRNVFAIVPTLLIAAILVAAACERHAKAVSIFSRERCNECHTIRGKGGSVGPDLSAVGRRRSREYIVEHIRNPRSHNPHSVMPSFGRLPDQDIQALADYLSGLK